MSTEVLHIELPTEVAERIRAHVRNGEYSSESEVIADRFTKNDDLNHLSPDNLEEAFRLGVEALEEAEQDPDGWLTHEQMLENLAKQHATAQLAQ